VADHGIERDGGLEPGLAIESYTRGAPDDFRKGWGVKTLFRPFPDFRFGIHRPTVKGAGRDPDKARAAELPALGERLGPADDPAVPGGHVALLGGDGGL
jgi:hypothetical protein